jgi:hypothetical protein
MRGYPAAHLCVERIILVLNGHVRDKGKKKYTGDEEEKDSEEFQRYLFAVGHYYLLFLDLLSFKSFKGLMSFNVV